MKTDLSLKKIDLFKKDIFSYHQDIYVKKRSLSLNSINDYLIKKKKIKKNIKNNFLQLKSKLSLNSEIYLFKDGNKKNILKVNLLEQKSFKNKEIRKINFLTKNLKFLSCPYDIFDFQKKRHELIQFIEGKIFNGNLNEFIRILKLYNKFFLKKKNNDFKKVEYFTQKEEKNLKRFYYQNFPNNKYMKLVINEWDRLKFQFKNKKKIKKILFHNDIHPKNVLIKKDGNIVILDYQSYKQVVPEIAFSYSLLKMTRQVVSKSKKSLNKRILSEIKKKVKKYNFCVNKWNLSVSDLAIMEILRRICIIIKIKNIYIKNKVLIILIRNLLEAHYLFGKIKLNK